jgi:hypothetical protein
MDEYLAIETYPQSRGKKLHLNTENISTKILQVIKISNHNVPPPSTTIIKLIKFKNFQPTT